MKKNLRWVQKGFCFLTTAALLAGCGAGPSSSSSGGSGKGTSSEAGAQPQATAAAAETWAETWAADGDISFNSMYSEAGEAKASALAGDSSMSMKYRTAYGDENFNTEEYNYISENGYKTTAEEPLSTFSVDVDTASYTNLRRYIHSGQEIPADAVRIEEMLNYFRYDYPEPKSGEPFSVTTEYSDCPWNEDNRLLLIGLKAKEIDFSHRPASNLVFLLDISGSMYSDDKLPLVQKSFTMLAENLEEKDRVSIVTYAGYESVVLDGVPGDQTAKIAAAIDDLEAGGSTAGAAGIEKAYELARKNYISGGNNRVILATDGDLNVGISSEGELTRLIKEKKKDGIHLSVIGVGTGNLKDNKMEALADNGDGNYNYIDSIYEAKKVLVDEMGGTLVTVAKDVKIQVEFNPKYVSGYRLIGYENRLLNQEDFNNDKVDAGEIGSGHCVTALYEIVPADGGNSSGTQLKYQASKDLVDSTELLTVNLRYKAPNGSKSTLLTYPVESDTYKAEPSETLSFAAAVAEFGMVLRDSEHKGDADYDTVLALAEPCIHANTDDYKKEFLQLVEMAKEQYD